MQIDWITVSAQIVNFLVLVWLLKRFLYRPVLDAMDRRERRVAERLEQAHARERQAAEAAEEHERRQRELARERDDILAAARREAEDEKKQLLEEARAQATEARRQWQRQAEREKEEFLGNLRLRAVESIQSIVRKTLRDLADSDLEERMVVAFMERMKTLDAQTRKTLKNGSGAARIASSFELDAGLRRRLTRTLHEQIDADMEVDYGRSPELLCGIELTRDDRRLGWNLADHLDQLEQRIGEAFDPVGQGDAGGERRAA